MKYLIWPFLLLALGSSAAAQSNGYKVDTAPWSDQEFEVCPVATETGLRAVIFKPEIETWAYPATELPTTKLVASADGIKEVIVKNERNLSAYFLKEQKIGYLDEGDFWVDENSIRATTFEQLQTISGKKVRPSATILYETFVYKADLDLEHAAAMEKIHYEPPCSAFSVGHYNKLETETNYDFGQNNPYHCDAETGFKRGQKFNYTKKSYRPVVTIPDGSSYYVKYPDGKIKTYPWHGFERLYNEDGSLVCDWNDLGSLIGYNLIEPPTQ